MRVIVRGFVSGPGLSLTLAQGNFRFPSGSDILDGADDPNRPAIILGRHGLGSRINPAPLATARADAVLGLNERRNAAKL